MPNATWRSSAPASSASRPRWRSPNAACGRWCWRRRRSAPARRGATAGGGAEPAAHRAGSTRRLAAMVATGADAVFALYPPPRHRLRRGAGRLAASGACREPRPARGGAGGGVAGGGGALCLAGRGGNPATTWRQPALPRRVVRPQRWCLDPLGYTRGLARAALAAGAAIHASRRQPPRCAARAASGTSLRRAARCSPGRVLAAAAEVPGR